MTTTNICKPSMGGIKRSYRSAFADRMRVSSFESAQEQTPGLAAGPSNRERKREMKFQAKQVQMIQTSIMGVMCEPTDVSQTTEDEETEEDGTGNTGKPWRPHCWSEHHHPSESDETVLEVDPEVYLEAARRMETLFQATLLTVDVAKGRGGCEGLRFRCANNHEFTTSFEKLAKFNEFGSTPTKFEAKHLWCIKCHNFFYRCIQKANENAAEVTSEIFKKGHVEL